MYGRMHHDRSVIDNILAMSLNSYCLSIKIRKVSEYPILCLSNNNCQNCSPLYVGELVAAVSRVTDVPGSGWWCQQGDMINDGPAPTLPVAPVFCGISNKEMVNYDMMAKGDAWAWWMYGIVS